MSEGVVRRTFRVAFTENLGLKAISIVFAVGLFAAIRGGEDAQRAVYIDVVTLAPPPDTGRVLVVDVPDRVKVVLQGPRSILNGLRGEEIPPVQADLRARTRDRSFDFEDSLFQLPAGVRVRSISPASFPVQWEARRDRRLRVVPTLRGEPLPGQGLKGAPSVSPSEVTLSGAVETVDAVEAAYTESIDLQGLGTGRYTKSVRLRRPPPHSWFDRMEPLQVRFEIGPDLAERALRQLPVRAVNTAWRMDVQPRTIDVVLRGPREAIATVDPDRLLPFVDGKALEERGPGSYREEPQLEDLPEGVEVVIMTPSHVFVDVRRPR